VCGPCGRDDFAGGRRCGDVGWLLTLSFSGLLKLLCYEPRLATAPIGRTGYSGKAQGLPANDGLEQANARAIDLLSCGLIEFLVARIQNS
jgi:hypothetical protein